MAIERTTNCDESCSSQFGITHAGDLQWQWYYVYTETESDKNGNYEVWSGEVFLCIHRPNGFMIVGDLECDTGFYEIDTGKAPTWTFTLE